MFIKFTKGGFFSESAMCFLHCQNKYSKSLSWTWNLNFPPITVNKLFKFQAQDSSPVSNIESNNSQNVGLEDYNNIYVEIFQYLLPPL